MGDRRRLTPRKQPKQRRAQHTVVAILEAAAQVFEEEGYARATTDRIAERAGVSIGSLYQYFPGKDALVVALAEEHVTTGVQMVRDLLAAAGGSEAMTQLALPVILRGFVEQLIELHRARPRLHRLLFAEAAMPQEFHRRLNILEEELAGELAALLSRHPAVKASDLELKAWVLVNTTEGLVHEYVIHPPAASRDEFVRHLVNLLSGYLTADSG